MLLRVLSSPYLDGDNTNTRTHINLAHNFCVLYILTRSYCEYDI